MIKFHNFLQGDKLKILSVSEFNEKIKNLLESHFLEVYVEGEISRPTYHTSGHLYFSLKDKGSTLKCVMFRSFASKLDFRLEDGQKVIASGRVSVYKPRGEYQLYATTIVPSGAGSLALAYEQLKKRLQAKGYFDKTFKKKIPKYIDKIALVTSKTGAALQDMLKVINRRWPLLKVYIINTLVQGKDAAEDIASSVKFADTLGVDLIIVGRGGGSLEDLWTFNEEVVADAIFEAKTPIVSAVGHEIDFLISDLVADLRAPTPSAAIEMVLPDRLEKLMYIDSLQEQIQNSMHKVMRDKFDLLRHLLSSFEHNSPKKRVEFYLKEIEALKKQLKSSVEFYLQRKESLPKELRLAFTQSIKQCLIHKEHESESLKERLSVAFESKKVKKGFAQVIKNAKVVDLEELSIGDIFELQTQQIKIEAKVLKKEDI
ncbi:exodeoxyribonuclease VII large subunit [Nitrosophilus labii]|uniref:exodeoxyribonuclease VII large subunit n=1 Tax=Nitrosophilus labii TaxID=2706014 RepID=UPI001FE5E7BE|nr:exodeoxyribonuclease VII large subunit [Nitrosophilus labii]